MSTSGPSDELQRLFAGKGAHLGRLTHLLAEHYGDREAFEDPDPSPGVHEGGTRTYLQIEDAVARYAAAHRASGVGHDDRVMVLVSNRLDVFLHALAVARLRGIAVPVNPRLKAGELDAVREATGAKWVVADPDVVERVGDAIDAGVTWLPATGADSIEAWLHDNPEIRVPAPADMDPSKVALFLTTSGTTGVPKAAALTSRGLLETPGRLGRIKLIGREGRDVVLVALPMAHVMGFGNVLGMLCGGVRVIHRARFDPIEMLDLIESRRPNAFIGVPTMFADLEAAGAAERDLSSIRLFASSADAMPEERARRFQKYGRALTVRGRGVGRSIFTDGYGMVELSGAGAIRLYPPSPKRLRMPSISAVVPGLEARAVDDDGKSVRPGKVGELQFRGPGVLEHYEGHEDAGPDTDGWFPSGDFARVWPGGLFFSLSGRSKDRLNVGGFSVFPAEVETDLAQHPGVAEVALVGIPDDRLGERPVALVVPRAVDFDADEFLTWAKQAVAGYRCPREVHVVDQIPRGNNAKVDRAAATALGQTVTTG